MNQSSENAPKVRPLVVVSVFLHRVLPGYFLDYCFRRIWPRSLAPHESVATLELPTFAGVPGVVVRAWP